jgi:hypothetical protein
MKKLFQSSLAILVILTGIAIISTSSYSIDDAMAFPHATLIIEPEDEHANDFQVVLGIQMNLLMVNFQAFMMENII